MRFSAGFVAIAFAYFVAAIPATKAPEGIRIPLSRRNNLINPDGSTSPDILRKEVSSATAKIRRGFEAYEKNTGTPHPLTNGRAAEMRGVAAEPLQKVNVGNLWQGEIEIGTPSKKFLVEFQTGISEFWVAGPECGDICKGHAKYDPKSSKTSTDSDKAFHWLSADGNTVAGELYSDTVKIQGLTVFDQTFGAGNNVSDGYWLLYDFPTDGILGLGFPQTSSFNATPIFQNLISQRQVNLPVFGLKLKVEDDSQGSELTLGGVNRDLYKEPFHYSRITNKGYWQIEMDSLAVNDKEALGKTSVIIDSGVRLIVGDTNAVAELMSKIPGSKDGSATVGPGFWTIPCNSPPTISLTFGGKSWDISPETFNLQPITESDCLAGISGAPIGPDYWIIGDVFLRSVYTVFDIGLETIGFAEYA